MGIPVIYFINKDNELIKNFITQEMLKKNILASNCIYLSIFHNNSNITLEEMHILVEQNKGDEQSQILLTRTWLNLIENCDRNCSNDIEIINNIKNNLLIKK